MAKVIVTGDQELIAKLEAFYQMNELTRAYKDCGDTGKRVAAALAPVSSGRLRESVRSSLRGTQKVVIQAGTRSFPYAPIVHYGQYKSYQNQPFLTNARAILDNSYVEIRFDREMSNTMKIVGL